MQMTPLRYIAFITESELDRELLCSSLMVVGDRSGARWEYSLDMNADVVFIDTDNESFFNRFRKHTRSVVVGYGSLPRRGTHYHLQKPLRMRDFMDLLAHVVRDGLNEHDEVVRHYMAELGHTHMTLDVVIEMVQRLAHGNVDKESVARHMGISASTLQRRLAAEGVSFRQLLNETRRDLAERYLKEGRRPIKDVAYSLGFADLSNFTRAFRGWFGMSPREYQKTTRQAV